MRIAIYGLSKTGTTALFYKLKQAMPDNTACYFEPGEHHLARLSRQKSMARLGIGRHRPVLVKFLPLQTRGSAMLDSFGAFDKSILITRDPRDRLISILLYQSYDSPIAMHPAAIAEFVALLAHKQSDPASVSLIDLMRTFYTLQDGHFDLAAWQARYIASGPAGILRFADAHPAYFRFRYEDIVDRNFGGLASYTGLPLRGDAVVETQLERVVRTRRYDGWRDWFTPQDVEELGPMFQPYLDRYYPQADWTLAQTPSIDPEHSSQYVVRVVNERRAAQSLPQLALPPLAVAE